MPFVRKGIGLLVIGLVMGLIGCGSAGGSGSGGGPGHGGSASGGWWGQGGAGSTGAAGMGGAAGAEAESTVACTITATSTFAAPMPNVAIVTWSTSLEGLTGAEIDFAPEAGGATSRAPVDLTQPDYRTLLVGMKQRTSYVFRIIAHVPGGACVSDPYPITTGAVPGSTPTASATILDGEAHDRGFIVTSTGLSGSTTFIIDPDGDVVWAASGPSVPSRAHLSWDGTRMYTMAINVRNTGMGSVESVAMDGTGARSFSGLTASHHDLTAIPGGFATLLWNQPGSDVPCSLVEVDEASGAITTVVADMGTVYTSSTFHTNSVHYYPGDDTYTVGDRNPSCYVKLTRGGQLVWQFGGSNPKDPSKFFSGVPTWSVNHGHQLCSDGTFVFFNNGANEAWAYTLDEKAMTATKTLGYKASGATSPVLGDVQRLPNGNYLVTFSESGQIHEIGPTGALVAKFTSPSFGYAEFRESLYGPPPY